jgi:hypothetical protein
MSELDPTAAANMPQPPMPTLRGRKAMEEAKKRDPRTQLPFRISALDQDAVASLREAGIDAAQYVEITAMVPPHATQLAPGPMATVPKVPGGEETLQAATSVIGGAVPIPLKTSSIMGPDGKPMLKPGTVLGVVIKTIVLRSEITAPKWAWNVDALAPEDTEG